MLACASGRTRGGAAAQAANFRRDLGTAALRDVERQVPRVLNQHQFEIERDASSPSLLTIQTRWNLRLPLPDEVERGALEARTRLTLNARSRFRTGSSADVRVVEMVAENMILVQDSTTTVWRSGFTTPMFERYLDEIADDLRTELRAGVRVN